MKIRLGFVTNSSSSSFIISTKSAVPEKYKDTVKPMSLDYFYNEVSEAKWNSVSYGIEDEDFQKLGSFTNEQMQLIKLAISNELDDYLEIKKKLEENKDKPLYYIYADRDWLYYQDALNEFINNSEIIDRRTDL